MPRKKTAAPKKAAAAEENGSGERLIGLLDSVTERDLKAIDAKIAGIKAQMDTLAKERKGLGQIRRMIDVKLHGMPTEKRASKNERREKIAEYLGEQGPATVRQIAVATEIPIPSVRKLLKGSQFAEQENGHWGLALEPRQGPFVGSARALKP